MINLNESISLEQFKKIVFLNDKIKISPDTMAKVERSYCFLESFSKDKLIYGITTGFGPMAEYRVDDSLRVQLQYNFIRSHATGTGNTLPPLYVRALMVARLITLLHGYSGIHPEVPELIVNFINHQLVPQIFEHGSVGASGDLVQLNHFTLNLIGEGELFYQGKLVNAADALALLNLKPINMHIREALALANGTSCMTGIAIANLLYAQKLLHYAVIASVMMNEITNSFSDHFSKELNQVKLHQGQQIIAEQMRLIAQGSKRLRNRTHYLYEKKITDSILKIKVQEFYSLRCVPQVLGPVADILSQCQTILMDEINSVSDNPIIDADNQNVFHGGNFHGDYVSIEMDKLKIAITKLTMLMERQLNFLCHDKINHLLPPFTNRGVLGLNYGMQAAQFTATSTTAECQTLSNPMSIHSIPCNNDNQDVVSMGTNSALITKTVIDNAFQVLAIHFIAIAQAIDCLQIENELAPQTVEMYHLIRQISPSFIEDKPLYPDINNVCKFLKQLS